MSWVVVHYRRRVIPGEDRLDLVEGHRCLKFVGERFEGMVVRTTVIHQDLPIPSCSVGEDVVLQFDEEPANDTPVGHAAVAVNVMHAQSTPVRAAACDLACVSGNKSPLSGSPPLSTLPAACVKLEFLGICFLGVNSPRASYFMVIKGAFLRSRCRSRPPTRSPGLRALSASRSVKRQLFMWRDAPRAHLLAMRCLRRATEA